MKQVNLTLYVGLQMDFKISASPELISSIGCLYLSSDFHHGFQLDSIMKFSCTPTVLSRTINQGIEHCHYDDHIEFCALFFVIIYNCLLCRTIVGLSFVC